MGSLSSSQKNTCCFAWWISSAYMRDEFWPASRFLVSERTFFSNRCFSSRNFLFRFFHLKLILLWQTRGFDQPLGNQWSRWEIRTLPRGLWNAIRRLSAVRKSGSNAIAKIENKSESVFNHFLPARFETSSFSIQIWHRISVLAANKLLLTYSVRHPAKHIPLRSNKGGTIIKRKRSLRKRKSRVFLSAFLSGLQGGSPYRVSMSHSFRAHNAIVTVLPREVIKYSRNISLSGDNSLPH